MPEIEARIKSLHQDWRRNPETRPTEQTYLVVVYGISFEYQPYSKWNPGGPVYLYQKTDYLRSHISTTPLNERLDPPEGSFNDQFDFPTRQVFAVSILVWAERPFAAGGSGRRIPIAAGGSGQRIPIAAGGSGQRIRSPRVGRANESRSPRVGRANESRSPRVGRANESRSPRDICAQTSNTAQSPAQSAPDSVAVSQAFA